MSGQVKIEKLDEEKAEAHKKRTKEESVKYKKTEYLKNLRN